MRFAIDTGGTFTDLVIEDRTLGFRVFKAPTTPSNPIDGILDVFLVAATALGLAHRDLLARGDILIHATTRATNAILMGTTAKTGLLLTEGHPDILVLREGGRTEPFNHTRSYPEPYIPRSLTFEVPERVTAGGRVLKPLDENGVRQIIDLLKSREVEAVGVCLLWSVVNPAHEERIGQLLEQELPGIPYTLSHRLNPTLREYRRASSTAIDASLKPLMSQYFADTDKCLRDAGFGGRILAVTATGGLVDSTAIAAAPIYAIGSGPAMAPVAGQWFAKVDAQSSMAIVADAGGTSYDVSLVRSGRIPTTREGWLGPPFVGHMTALPAVDVKSIGAGGGSLARVDHGGLLRVGPESAGARPGPVCYGRGGVSATVTDAAVVLGYVDAEYFLGGEMQLDALAALAAIDTQVARPLRLSADEAASAVITLATQHMVQAIEEITLNQGVDPRSATLIGGGGAAGLNAVAIARRLGCAKVVIPEVGAALSAFGALLSDLSTEYSAAFHTSTANFDVPGVNQTLNRLVEKCRQFIAGPGSNSSGSTIELIAEARYPHQVWELDLSLRQAAFGQAEDVEHLRGDFHALHKSIFAVDDPGSPVEIVGFRARARCHLQERKPMRATSAKKVAENQRRDSRSAYFPRLGRLDVPVRHLDAFRPGERLTGPLIIESRVTTVVIDPEATVERLETGSLLIFASTHSLAKPESQQVRADA
ncbi:MAG: hydantoinase/oxoprolinase family protein [Candidatus Dormibacteraceae bacterium]